MLQKWTYLVIKTSVFSLSSEDIVWNICVFYQACKFALFLKLANIIVEER